MAERTATQRSDEALQPPAPTSTSGGSCRCSSPRAGAWMNVVADTRAVLLPKCTKPVDRMVVEPGARRPDELDRRRVLIFASARAGRSWLVGTPPSLRSGSG
ncbi:hypothetical protein HBB16_04680 [Pseudonocardia sp. MCCB 268]|nr:hypothetical protein [Pseudonocardia cytotoxica]